MEREENIASAIELLEDILNEFSGKTQVSLQLERIEEIHNFLSGGDPIPKENADTRKAEMPSHKTRSYYGGRC